jgi:head-tail adaptor
MIRPHLNRRLTLEAEALTADGAGGFVSVWQALGTVWASVEVGSAREVVGGERLGSVQPVKVTVRAADEADPARPERGKRFREAGRVYPIQAVQLRDPRGMYLTCQCTEEGGA